MGATGASAGPVVRSPRRPGAAAWLLFGLLILAVLVVRPPATVLEPPAPSQLGVAATIESTGQRFQDAPLFSAASIAPGTRLSESVRIANTGQVPFRLRLRAAPAAAALLPAVSLWDDRDGVQAWVQREDGWLLYQGPLGGLDTEVIARLLTLEERRFGVSIWLPQVGREASRGRMVAVQFFLDCSPLASSGPTTR